MILFSESSLQLSINIITNFLIKLKFSPFYYTTNSPITFELDSFIDLVP